MDENVLRGWVRAAQDDFNATQFLLDEEPLRLEVICFHAEKAAEKMLKAYLVSRGQAVPASEDCLELLDACAIVNAEIMQLKENAENLSGYRDWGIVEITEEELHKVLSSSEKVLDWIEHAMHEERISNSLQ